MTTAPASAPPRSGPGRPSGCGRRASDEAMVIGTWGGDRRSRRRRCAVEEGREALDESRALLDERRLATPLEDGELRSRHERVDLLGLIDRADPVVPPDGDESRASDSRQLGAAVIRRVLVADDEVAHGNPIPRVCPRQKACGGQPLVEEVERADGLERATEALVVLE